MAYNSNIPDELAKDFSWACKVLGFKQKAVISGYMEYIIQRAKKYETLSRKLNELKVITFDEPLSIDLYFKDEKISAQIESIEKTNNEDEEEDI